MFQEILLRSKRCHRKGRTEVGYPTCKTIPRARWRGQDSAVTVAIRLRPPRRNPAIIPLGMAE